MFKKIFFCSVDSGDSIRRNIEVNSSGQNSGFKPIIGIFSEFWVFTGVFIGGVAALLFIVLPLLKGNRKTHKNESQRDNTTSLVWGDLSQAFTEEVEFLSTEELLNWFYTRRAVKKSNENIVAFSTAGSIVSGKFSDVIRNEAEEKYYITQGFYNKINDEVLEFRVIKAANIDDSLLRNHQDGSVNLYK
ncbi:hypothetical protein H6G81_28040 [Scytonema hofmannii FACHB-248]|uniref:Uncharacterized protein n=1 Tax=Scytonema hofmannii FACHB-248 TaxID=1842502 RepID=A0ABR8GXJ1_9CYAN|nr:hypothetical protein [Scytonema hofmannii]MBD2608261.1 hypothetical protein [Scytonema hofmannii FACHB-248]